MMQRFTCFVARMRFLDFLLRSKPLEEKGPQCIMGDANGAVRGISIRFAFDLSTHPD